MKNRVPGVFPKRELIFVEAGVTNVQHELVLYLSALH